MFDDLHAYFHENVLDTYANYLKTRKSGKSGKSHDLKSAINIATILYHLREQIPEKQRINYDELALHCPDYKLLGNIVNATKHKKINKHNPQISSAENIYEQIVRTEYEDKKGKFS